MISARSSGRVPRSAMSKHKTLPRLIARSVMTPIVPNAPISPTPTLDHMVTSHQLPQRSHA
jgi:hypothetical protein